MQLKCWHLRPVSKYREKYDHFDGEASSKCNISHICPFAF